MITIIPQQNPPKTENKTSIFGYTMAMTRESTSKVIVIP